MTLYNITNYSATYNSKTSIPYNNNKVVEVLGSKQAIISYITKNEMASKEINSIVTPMIFTGMGILGAFLYAETIERVK